MYPAGTSTLIQRWINVATDVESTLKFGCKWKRRWRREATLIQRQVSTFKWPRICLVIVVFQRWSNVESTLPLTLNLRWNLVANERGDDVEISTLIQRQVSTFQRPWICLTSVVFQRWSNVESTLPLTLNPRWNLVANERGDNVENSTLIQRQVSTFQRPWICLALFVFQRWNNVVISTLFQHQISTLIISWIMVEIN